MVNAQTQPPNQTFSGLLYEFKYALRADSIMLLPRNDTIGIRPSLLAPGAIIYRIADKTFYGYDGSYWKSFASGTLRALDSLRYDPSTGIFYGRYTTGGEFPVPTGLVDSLRYRVKLDTGAAQYLAIFKGDSAIGVTDISYIPSVASSIGFAKEFKVGRHPLVGRSAKLMTSDTLTLNNAGYHSIGAYDVIQSIGGSSAYAIFDAAAHFIGAGPWSHFYGFQSRPQLEGTGNIADYYGYETLLQHTGSGTVTTAVGVKIEDVVGSGPITNQYGIYLAPQTKGTNKWSIYSAGGNSYFAGNIGIGVTVPTVPLDVSGAIRAGSVTSNGIITISGTAPQMLFAETDNTSPTMQFLFNDSTWFVNRVRDNTTLMSIRNRDGFTSFAGPVQSNHSFTVNSAAPYFRFKNTSLSNQDWRIITESGDQAFQTMNTDSTNIANKFVIKYGGTINIPVAPAVGALTDSFLVRRSGGDIYKLPTSTFLTPSTTGSLTLTASPYTSSIRSNLISSNYRAGFNTETNGSYNFAISSAPTSSPVFRWLFKLTTAVDYTVDTDELMRLTSAGNLGVGNAAPTARGDFSSSTGYNQLRLRTAYTPTSSADTNGNTGDVSWDANYIYIKTAAGWKRSALTTF